MPVLAPELGQQLNKATLMSAETLANTLRVVGLKDGRRMAAVGDTIFVSGPLDGHAQFQIIRPLQSIADPETNQVLALASLRIGTVALQSAADAMHSFRVTSSDTEIRIGDHLIPWVNLEQPAWFPHPAATVAGRVAAVLKGATWASVSDIVAINRGARHGLDAGSVVALVRRVRIHTDASQPNPSSSTPEEIAALLVFDVADHAALAVVMRASDTFTTGDTIESVNRNAR